MNESVSNMIWIIWYRCINDDWVWWVEVWVIWYEWYNIDEYMISD